jgi:membrane protein
MKQAVRDAFVAFRMHDGRLLSGALAFHVLLAVAPIGVIALAVAGLVFGREAQAGELVEPLAHLMNDDLARFVSETVERAAQPRGSVLASIFGFVFFVFAVARLFSHLRMSLNHVWGVRATVGLADLTPRVVLDRLRAAVTLLVLGLAVPAFTALKTWLGWAGRYFGGAAVFLSLGELVFSISVLTLLFALIFRFVPDVRIAFSDALRGALFTAILATIGALLVALYLSHGGGTSAFGAAGSVVALLLWTYYMAQIFFLGAELTAGFARRTGHGLAPRPYAKRVETHDPIDDTVDGEAGRRSIGVA